MLIIPLRSTPSQKLSVVLATQNCQISIYMKTTGLYFDLSVNDAPVRTCVLCRDRTRLIRQTYLGFTGDLAFYDTQGREDPKPSGLGSRFLLAYLEATDI